MAMVESDFFFFLITKQLLGFFFLLRILSFWFGFSLSIIYFSISFPLFGSISLMGSHLAAKRLDAAILVQIFRIILLFIQTNFQNRFFGAINHSYGQSRRWSLAIFSGISPVNRLFIWKHRAIHIASIIVIFLNNKTASCIFLFASYPFILVQFFSLHHLLRHFLYPSLGLQVRSLHCQIMLSFI